MKTKTGGGAGEMVEKYDDNLHHKVLCRVHDGVASMADATQEALVLYTQNECEVGVAAAWLCCSQSKAMLPSFAIQKHTYTCP